MILSIKAGKTKVDEREWRKMKRNLTRGQQLAVNVGWLDGKVHSGERNTQNVTVAQIAKWLEEGHLNGGMGQGTFTMSRPFIRQGFMHIIKNTSWLQTHISFAFPSIAGGRQSWTTFNNHLGKSAVELMKQTMDVWSIPQNTERTVELKGFNNPLIETGETRESIGYKLAKKEAGGND